MIGKNLTSLAGCLNDHNLTVVPDKTNYEKTNHKTLIDRSYAMSHAHFSPKQKAALPKILGLKKKQNTSHKSARGIDKLIKASVKFFEKLNSITILYLNNPFKLT